MPMPQPFNGSPSPLRLRLGREGDRKRLITRGGYNLSKRYPWLTEAARKVRQKRFVIDGEAVILGVDGVSDFDALHPGRHNDEVQLCAFDVLAMDGDALRKLPLSMRKANLARLLARRPEGIFINPFEQGEIGPDLFASSDLKVWCQSAGIGPMRPDGRSIGLRSRTGNINPTLGLQKRFGNGVG